MIGVKSVEREKEEKRTDDERREMLTKVRMYHEVAGKVLALKAQRVLEATILPLTSHLLLLNPEFHIVWSYRREIIDALLAKHKEAGESAAADVAELAKTELKLTFEALQRNPKSYAAWYQRQWVIDKGLGDLAKEIGLCTKLLDLDERNFHCWNYRRHVCRLAGVSRDDELAFSTTKIEQNFSNYSALHHRSVTLPRPLTQEALQDEIGIVQQAVFTEPDDQSAWFYYRWLLTSMLDTLRSQHDPAAVDEFLESQVQWMSELREMEQEAKWVLVTLGDVHRRRGSKEGTSEAQACYKLLQGIDPDHKQYYVDMIRGLMA